MGSVDYTPVITWRDKNTGKEHTQRVPQGRDTADALAVELMLKGHTIIEKRNC